MIDPLSLSSAPSALAPGHGQAPGHGGSTPGGFEKALGAILEARDATTTVPGSTSAILTRQAAAVDGKGLPQPLLATVGASETDRPSAVLNWAPSRTDPTASGATPVVQIKAALTARLPAAVPKAMPAQNAALQTTYDGSRLESAVIYAEGTSLAAGPSTTAPVASAKIAAPMPAVVLVAPQGGTDSGAPASRVPAVAPNTTLVAIVNDGASHRPTATAKDPLPPSTTRWRDKGQGLLTGASAAAVASANVTAAATAAPLPAIDRSSHKRPAAVQSGAAPLAPLAASIEPIVPVVVVRDATPAPTVLAEKPQPLSPDNSPLLLLSPALGKADPPLPSIADTGPSTTGAAKPSISLSAPPRATGARVQTLSAFLEARDATATSRARPATARAQPAHADNSLPQAVRIDANDATIALVPNPGSPLVAPAIAFAPATGNDAELDSGLQSVETVASPAAAQRAISVTSLRSAPSPIVTTAISSLATPTRPSTLPSTGAQAPVTSDIASAADADATIVGHTVSPPAVHSAAIVQTIPAAGSELVAAAPSNAPARVDTPPVSITLPNSDRVDAIRQPEPSRPELITTAQPLPIVSTATAPVATPLPGDAGPLVPAAVSAPAAPLPIVAASSAITPPAVPQSPPRVDRSDPPIRVAQRDAAVPAITVSTTPQPAGQVFAAAIAAATSWRDKPAARNEGDTATLSVALSPASTVDLRGPASVSTTGKTDATPLDLRQDQGLQHMIDRIETLRDDANARDTRIKLTPDALGSVDVAVRQDGDRVHVRFTAQHEATRALIAEAQPRLTELASARGVRIGDTSVTTDSAGGGNGAAPQPRPTPQPSRTPPRARSEATDDPVDHRLA